MYMACGTRTDVARALGSILEAPGGFGVPKKGQGVEHAGAQSSDSTTQMVWRDGTGEP